MYFTKPQCHPDTEQRATIWGHGHICNKRLISSRPHLFSGNGKGHGVPMLSGWLWVGSQYHEAHLGNNAVLKPHLGGTLQFNSEPQLAPRATAILPKRTMTEKYKRKVTINQISKGGTPSSPFKKKIRFCSHHTCPRMVRWWRIHFRTPDYEVTGSSGERSAHLKKEQERHT